MTVARGAVLVAVALIAALAVWLLLLSGGGHTVGSVRPRPLL